MRKTSLMLTLALVVCLGTLAHASVSVFFMPDSGYLKVAGQITIEPTVETMMLLLFPHAQITEFWIEGLQTYELERVTQGTLINFTLAQPGQENILSLSYEGFLPLQGDQINLDRDTLWFPEFSFPAKTSIVRAEVPQGWDVTLFDQKNNYPTLTITRLNGENEVKFSESNLEVPEEKTPLDLKLSPSLAPTQEEFLSKIQIQVTRLVNQINLRNLQGLQNIIGDQLKTKGLPSYLATLPKSYGTISSEFRSTPSFPEEPFQIVLSTQKGPRFLATMSWLEQEDRMLLEEFSLTPLGQAIPLVVEESLAEFVEQIQTASQNQDRDFLLSMIDNHSSIDEYKIAEFIINLNSAQQWELRYISLDPLSITIVVKQTTESSLLLNVGLLPGEDHWLIKTLDVIPLR